MVTRTGDDNPEFLEGGSFEDSLSGAGGNDTLMGYGGNDTLNGGTGDDELWGVTGNDTLYGGDGNDILRADGDPAGATNFLDGGAGNDQLRGSAGNDTLIGGLGDDTLDAGGGIDLLQGGDGNDQLSTSLAGRFTLQGGAGSDTFSTLNLGHSSVVDMSGGAGSDTFIATYEPPNADWSDSLIRCLDFKAGPGGDRIDLAAIFPWMTGLVGIDDPFDERLGYLRLVQQGKDTALQVDPDGKAGADSHWHTLLLLKGVSASAMTLGNFIGTTNVGALSVAQGAGTAPTLVTPIPELPAKPGASIGFKVPSGSFADADVGDPMQLSAALAGGGALPGWLAFDIRTQTFTGTLPAANPQLPLLIRVTATDAAGLSVSDVFAITPATAGNDSLRGAAGDDVYDGLAGDDTIDGSLGNDSIDGNLGDDRLLGDAGNDTLAGGAGNDTLIGADGQDKLSGGDGNDSLDGGTGNDTMTGGAGNDSYAVDSSADKVVEAAGGGSSDRVNALATYTLAAEVEMLVLGGSGNLGGTGNALSNTLTGNSGHNRLNGADGNDTLMGSSGNDTLSGGNGDDSLDGGAGNDSMSGGTGNDSYVVNVAGDKVVEAAGGGTADKVTAFVNYTLGAEVENLVLGGSGNLGGTGNALANIITGNGGSNSLTGADGDDTLDGGTGSDTMTGGKGNDSYVVSGPGDRVVEAAGGGTADQVTAMMTYTLATELEHLVLGGTGNFGGTGNATANRITGNAANNILSGLDGNDTLAGGAGNDTLRGGNGNDSLNGGAGDDSMDGGAGNDRYVVDAGKDKVVELAGGGTADQVTALLTYTLAAEVEMLVLGGTGHINGTGNTLSNTLTGNSGNNVLNGAGGNDTLAGGGGNDTLSGGAGFDSFRFASPLSSGNIDRILDYSVPEDTLQLENSVFTKLTTTGVLSSANFRANLTGTASDSNDYIVYDTDSGELFYDADGSGAGVKVLIATLKGAPALTSADIFVT